MRDAGFIMSVVHVGLGSIPTELGSLRDLEAIDLEHCDAISGAFLNLSHACSIIDRPGTIPTELGRTPLLDINGI